MCACYSLIFLHYRLVWDINSLGHLSSTSRDSIINELADFDHILSTCDSSTACAVSADDTLCSRKHSELKESLQQISVDQRNTTQDVTTGDTHILTSLIGIAGIRLNNRKSKLDIHRIINLNTLNIPYSLVLLCP
jgi:hypothetical protein